jgi:hypothetical protein
MTGVTAPQDVTLEAMAAWTAGSAEESGSATIELKGAHESSLTLSLPSGQRKEIRNFGALSGANVSSTAPPGAWAGADSVWHAESLHNCWTDASWYFPAFTLQVALQDPTISLVYAGTDTFNGAPAYHLVLYRTLPGQSPGTTAIVQRLSTVHVYLDAVSDLPLGLRFDLHPDKNAGLDIPVEIHFSNYKAFSGIQIPVHITQFLQGSPLLDLQVGSVQVNSGLADGTFAMPAITTTDSSTTSGGGR